MKFCPQCGTTFETGTRFCSQCGFDKLSVETVETETTQTTDVSSGLPEKVGKSCPKCSFVLDADERFCPECGFDSQLPVTIDPVVVMPETTLAETIEIKATEPEKIVVPPVEPIKVEPVAEVETPIAAPIATPVIENTLNCPQCGNNIESDSRFCNHCGFDTFTGSKPIAEAEKAKPPKAAPEIIAIHTETKKVQVASSESKKRKWPLILLVIAAVAVLGIGGWLAYDQFFNKATDASTTIGPDTVTQTATAQTEPEVTDSSITEQPVEDSQSEKTATKPMSRIDQEIAKQKAREKAASATNNQTNTPQNQPEKKVKVLPGTATPDVHDKLATILMETGRKEEPKYKNPKNPSKLMIQKPTIIVRITTDHYNDGMGTPRSGTIIITDRDGNEIGSYKTYGKSGKNGVPNTKWVAEPRIKLEKGTYFISDTGKETWSKNFVGNGFVIVEGYEL